MNDSTDRKLQEIVDAALRSVRASASRQLEMREELLAHVSEVFAEELARTGDEHAALAATGRRFGVSAEVGSQLQQSIPLVERILLVSEKELLMSSKFWLAAIFAIATGPAIILPAAALYRDEGILQAFPFLLGGAILLAGLIAAGYGAARHLGRHA